jgi:hypothetical protein
MEYPKEKLHNWLVRNFKYLPTKKQDLLEFQYALRSLIELAEENIMEKQNENILPR